MAFGPTKSEDVGLIAVQLVSKISNLYVILIHQRYRRTGRRTNDMRSQYRALHYSASRGKKNFYLSKVTK